LPSVALAPRVAAFVAIGAPVVVAVGAAIATIMVRIDPAGKTKAPRYALHSCASVGGVRGAS